MELLNTKQVAELFPGLKPTTLSEWRQTPNKGPQFIKIGSRVFYTRKAVEDFISSRPQHRSTLELS